MERERRKERVSCTFRFDKSVREYLVNTAYNEDTSISSVLNKIIREHMKQENSN